MFLFVIQSEAKDLALSFAFALALADA